MNKLGLIIAGYGKPNRWIVPIISYTDLQDGRAYTKEHDGTYHFNDLQDIVTFNTEDNIGTLGGTYYKIPHDKIEYINA